jgi:hypothetical protein
MSPLTLAFKRGLTCVAIVADITMNMKMVTFATHVKSQCAMLVLTIANIVRDRFVAIVFCSVAIVALQCVVIVSEHVAIVEAHSVRIVWSMMRTWNPTFAKPVMNV